MKLKLVIVFFMVSYFGTAQNWYTNFEDAKKVATQENKNILLVFSGSDWCAPCIKLDKKVWQSEEFKTASNAWILVKADFPNKKANQLSEAQTAHNKKLAEKYNKDGNFPLVILLNKDGKTLGVVGYKNISAQDYIALLHTFEK